jgi:hypothetical protein
VFLLPSLLVLSLWTVPVVAATAAARSFRPPFVLHRKRSPSTSLTGTSTNNPLSLSLRGGSADVDTAQLVEQAYGWATNLGAPAALVAGAVIATLYETLSSGSLDVDETTDAKWVQIAKKATRMLLVSAFMMQIVCIFCTTVLGTQLISDPPLASKAVTSVQYLQEHYEFEVLTAKISFLQGLLTWLAAIAVEHAIPQDANEPTNRRNMDMLIASSLTTLIIAMLSFYNGHMNFYNNYLHMLQRYATVVVKKYFGHWPPKALTVLAIPSSITSIVFFFKVFLMHDVNTGSNKSKGKNL